MSIYIVDLHILLDCKLKCRIQGDTLLSSYDANTTKAFTPEFYRGTALLASFFSKLEEVSQQQGSNIEDKLDDLAPRVHDFLLSNDPLSVPPEIDLEPVPEWTDENELFRD